MDKVFVERYIGNKLYWWNVGAIRNNDGDTAYFTTVMEN